MKSLKTRLLLEWSLLYKAIILYISVLLLFLCEMSVFTAADTGTITISNPSFESDTSVTAWNYLCPTGWTCVGNIIVSKYSDAS